MVLRLRKAGLPDGPGNASCPSHPLKLQNKTARGKCLLLAMGFSFFDSFVDVSKIFRSNFNLSQMLSIQLSSSYICLDVQPSAYMKPAQNEIRYQLLLPCLPSFHLLQCPWPSSQPVTQGGNLKGAALDNSTHHPILADFNSDKTLESDSSPHLLVLILEEYVYCHSHGIIRMCLLVSPSWLS